MNSTTDKHTRELIVEGRKLADSLTASLRTHVAVGFTYAAGVVSKLSQRCQELLDERDRR